MQALVRFCFIVLLSLATSYSSALELPKGIIPQDGRPAPALTLSDMDGNSTELAKFKGRWVFVHFWASWCGPCRREMPTLKGMMDAMAEENFRAILINTAEDEDTVFSFMSAVAPELNTLMDVDGLVTEAWQPRGLPATYLVDPEGKIRYQALGGRPWDELGYVGFLKEITK
ncbi:MAG: TlpA family protein disulfide reductase [Gammaproteobacteria bacterium]|nr:TlpA family protein disulfide reductase [Gammaproteobacteria bacterium]